MVNFIGMGTKHRTCSMFVNTPPEQFMLREQGGVHEQLNMFVNTPWPKSESVERIEQFEKVWKSAATRPPPIMVIENRFYGIGLDGFVDEIIAVVDKRQDNVRFDPVRTIAQRY